MKTTIEFDLDNPDDYRRYKSYSQHEALSVFVFELIHNLKRKFENDNFDTETVEKIFEEIMEDFYNRGLNAENL